MVPVEGGEIVVRAVIPGTGDGGLSYPLLFWMHGGGWSLNENDIFRRAGRLSFAGLIFGNVDQDDYFMRNLSTELQVTTLNVDYRFVPNRRRFLFFLRAQREMNSLAPGHLFPVQLNDSFSALKWVIFYLFGWHVDHLPLNELSSIGNR